MKDSLYIFLIETFTSCNVLLDLLWISLKQIPLLKVFQVLGSVATPYFKGLTR